MNWFYIEDGPVQQCNCGFYYKLNRTEAPNMYGEIMGYDELDMVKRDRRRTPKGDLWAIFGPWIQLRDIRGSNFV